MPGTGSTGGTSVGWHHRPAETNQQLRQLSGGQYRTGVIANEISANRPVAVDITWPSGGSHVVAIARVQADIVLILDPANGQSVLPFANFPADYFGRAKLDGFTFTSRVEPPAALRRRGQTSRPSEVGHKLAILSANPAQIVLSHVVRANLKSSRVLPTCAHR